MQPIPSLERKDSGTATVTVPAGAAGTVVTAELAHSNIRAAKGLSIGSSSDTSFALDTSTVALTEIAPNKYENYNGFVANALNGEFYIDYETGVITIKKADTSTSFTCSYSYAIGEISADDIDVQINQAATGSTGLVAVTATATQVAAANTSRTTIAIVNEGSDPIRIGFDNTVTYNGTTSTDGILLYAGEKVTINNTSAIFAIHASGNSGNVSYAEETTS